VGLFWNRKKTIKAQVLAEVLLDGIFNDASAQPTEISIPADKKEVFASKVDFYKQALVLLAVICQEKEAKSYALVRACLEPILFQAASPEEGQMIVAEMKAAMTSLQEMFASNKQMSWSMAWLADIGINATNPADLMAFGWFWMGQFAAFQKTMATMEPKP
jgi:hypothetical protein